MSDFTGDESIADIIRMVLEEFSSRQMLEGRPGNVQIIYQDGLPILIFHARVINNLGEFVCRYRLDNMLANVFPECEKIYDEAKESGLIGESDEISRKKMVRTLAEYAMHVMLARLMLLQLAMFEENFNEAMLLTAGTLLGTFAQEYERVDGIGITKQANAAVKTWLDKTVDSHAKKKRELLVVLLNSLPPFRIPTGSGRPKGSTKPKDVKAREAAEYEQKVEATIRKLISPKGKIPTKRAVAKEIGIGGLSAGGTDSTLTNFSRKLKGLSIDYNAIVERVKLSK